MITTYILTLNIISSKDKIFIHFSFTIKHN
nr:MAG TPA_asm: hypothetical protein [Caudoviricetes sp.]